MKSKLLNIWLLVFLFLSIACGTSESSKITLNESERVKKGEFKKDWREETIIEEKKEAITKIDNKSESPLADNGSEVASWIQSRIEKVNAKQKEVVQIPIVFQSEGWGCNCPENWIGLDPDSHDGENTFIYVENISNTKFPSVKTRKVGDGEEVSAGMVVLVDGYFDKKIRRKDFCDGEKSDECVYELPFFYVTKIYQEFPKSYGIRLKILK